MAAYMRQALCTIGTFCRTFSQLHWSTFDTMPIEKRLVDRLNHLNIKIPTEIQQKSLGAVLKGENVIINAETGSGKTLCYLIPVLHNFLNQLPSAKKSGPSAIVLVPNMDLGYQIAELFNVLCDPGYYACPVHRDSKLHISEQYPLIVSTPHALLQYNIMSLSTVRTIIVDEADLIMANAGKSFRKLLGSFKEHSKAIEQVYTPGNKPRQFIFAAATLPHRGRNNVLKQITKSFPDVVHISSSMVHQYVSTVTSVDIFMEEEEKLPQLLRLLNILNSGLPNFGNSFESLADKHHLSLLAAAQRNKQLRILVFANTVATARNVFEFLNCQEGTTFEVLKTKNDNEESDVLCQHKISDDFVESSVFTKLKVLKDFSTKTGSVLPWRGKIGVLHKEVAMCERQEILEKFKTSEIIVLVSTDLASRGLDVLGISHVIQLDYACNAVDVLHRAGRTARAGAQGTVISFVTAKDQHLLKAIKLSQKGPGAEGFQEIFSRRKKQKF